MEIKIIQRNDLEEIKDLWQELNNHHRKFSTYFKEHFANFTFSQRAEQLTIKEKLVIFLAKKNDTKVGYCIATCNKKIGEIDSIYIIFDHRGKGIGQKLMKTAMHWLEKQECTSLSVCIAEGNESAIEFYRKFGFSERFTIMQRTKQSTKQL